jgi:hypothetical protein
MNNLKSVWAKTSKTIVIEYMFQLIQFLCQKIILLFKA